jgi:hypothetical protein
MASVIIAEGKSSGKKKNSICKWEKIIINHSLEPPEFHSCFCFLVLQG